MSGSGRKCYLVLTGSGWPCSGIAKLSAREFMSCAFDTGPGYRVYFAQDGRTLVILFTGGTKSSQRKDIAKAKTYWQDYRSRSNA